MCGTLESGESGESWWVYNGTTVVSSVPSKQESSYATREQRSREAGVELARLMERQLGYVEGHIDDIALRLFIRAHWNKIAALAHVIHDE